MDGRTIRGAFHLHTTRSDGALDRREVAAAASRAGLKFAVFTDHGNGVRVPDPPEYIDGVLCLDGVEVSTNQGHYAATGLPAMPYPLGGDASAVAEDVARLGGFGVAAHPVSMRQELAWRDWSVPVDGLEWINADSEWRDESYARLARGLMGYLVRPAEALATLLDRPVGALRQWDGLTARRQVVGLAGHDAHGGLGRETENRGRRLHLPSYEASFRTFSLNATLRQTPTGDPRRDADLLIDSLRTGNVFTVIDAIAGPAALDFHASVGAMTATMGGSLGQGAGTARFSVRATVPPGSTTSLWRNGEVIKSASGGVLEHEDGAFGAYRVEITLDAAPGAPPVPWLVSNPIYRLAATSTGAAVGPPSVLMPLVNGDWRGESDPGSAALVRRQEASVGLTYRLSGPPAQSPFAALVIDLRDIPPIADTIVLRGDSARPMRVSAQIRFAREQDRRWGSSIYLEPAVRDVRIPIAGLRFLGGSGDVGPTAPPRPPITSATSLLFVVDLTNALPGDEGAFVLRQVALGRQE